MEKLPAPTPEEQAKSEQLLEKTKWAIKQQGFLAFDEYLDWVMYAPELGYYTGNQPKIGSKGDFITAPALHPIFAQTLAHQLTELLSLTEGNIYEFGAGTGQLAAELLRFLPHHSVKNYYIIEISPYLSSLQCETIRTLAPHQAHKLHHLKNLPTWFNGVIIGNEVLDAIPFNLVSKSNNNYFEMGVTLSSASQLSLASRPMPAGYLREEAESYLNSCPAPYQTELHLRQKAFIRTICDRLATAAVLFIDYGFDAAQYYHPQRTMGTFIGHYHHHTIMDPFFRPGLTDLTAHVNFSAIAESVTETSTDLVGYTSQSNFLLNLGIIDFLEHYANTDNEENYWRASQACQTLLQPHEMGELFKVIAFTKNIELDWQGFSNNDWTHKL
ncbi:MAG: SAM-dependent methyltransferase [Neisseriaceae bacterium]